MSEQNNSQEKIIESLRAEISDLKSKLQIAKINAPDKNLEFYLKMSNEVFFRFLQRNSIESFDDLKNSDIGLFGRIDLTDKTFTGVHDTYQGHVDMLRKEARNTEEEKK